MDEIPYGYCHCGCGEKTTIAKCSNANRGHIKNQPLKFVLGHATRRPLSPLGTKRCCRCQMVLDKAKFTPDNRHVDGLMSACKECNAERVGQYRVTNSGKVKESQQRHYARNKDQIKYTVRQYREENLEKVKRTKRRHYQENTEVYRASRQNRRARRRSNGGHISTAEWQSVLDRFNGKCAKCGSADNIHMDHVVPLAKGGKHSPDNIQPLCQTCNLRKGVKVEDYRGKFYQPIALPLEDAA